MREGVPTQRIRYLLGLLSALAIPGPTSCCPVVAMPLWPCISIMHARVPAKCGWQVVFVLDVCQVVQFCTVTTNINTCAALRHTVQHYSQPRWPCLQADIHPTWEPPPGLGATQPPIAKKATGGIGQIGAVAKGHNHDIWIFHRGDILVPDMHWQQVSRTWCRQCIIEVTAASQHSARLLLMPAKHSRQTHAHTCTHVHPQQTHKSGLQ